MASKRKSLDMQDYRNWKVAKLRDEITKSGINVGTGFPLALLRKLYVDNVLSKGRADLGTVTGAPKNTRSKSNTGPVTMDLMDGTAATPSGTGTADHESDPGSSIDTHASRNRATTGNTLCVSTLDNLDANTRNIPGAPETGTLWTGHNQPGSCSSSSTRDSVLPPTRMNICCESSAPSDSTTTSGAGHDGLAMAPVLSLAQTMIQQLAQLVPKSNTNEVQYDLNSYYKNSRSNVVTNSRAAAVYAGGATRYGVAPEDVPHMDLVSPTVRRAVIQGKDVNLASLLIPYHDMQVDKDDKRLKRALNISEFISAFGKYKRIMCTAFPERRDELDHYEANIVQIHDVYGPSFYEYHKLYSLKCANALQLHQLKIDWSRKDQDLLRLISAGTTSNPCSICKEVSHKTQFCHITTDSYSNINVRSSNGTTTPAGSASQNAGTPNNRDRWGRPKVEVNGREVCNNYNEQTGCRKTDCFYFHACKRCKAVGHGMPNCTFVFDKKHPTRGGK